MDPSTAAGLQNKHNHRTPPSHQRLLFAVTVFPETLRWSLRKSIQSSLYYRTGALRYTPEGRRFVRCHWIFQLITMDLGSTQPLTETSTRNLPRCKRKSARRAYRHLCVNCLENVGASTSDNPMGLHGLLQG
jgi:hypothetical protein